MENVQSFILTQTMKELSNRFWIWYWIFKFLDPFCHVGVGICHSSEPYMLYARIMCKIDLLDDIFRISPNRYAFFWFNTEFTSSFESNTSLVDFNFVC